MNNHFHRVLLKCSLLLMVCCQLDAMPPHPEKLQRINEGIIPAPYYLENYDDLIVKGINSSKGIQINALTDDNFNVIVILVDFSDNTAQTAGSFFDDLVFDNSFGSVRHYMEEVTYDNITLTTENLPSTTNWYRAPQSYSYYVDGQNGMGDYPQNSQGLVEDLVNLADADIDFSQYDNDSDGIVDALIVVHSGTGAEYSLSDDDIGSHQWVTNSPIELDGVNITVYSIVPELWDSPNDMTCGVYAHEMGHAVFGLPDLYDRDGSSSGLGNWSLMAAGSWNGNLGSSPAHPDAWCKTQMGFVEPTVVAFNINNVTISAVENEACIFRLWTDGSIEDEYYLVENRQPIGYDASLPGDGLILYHVDEDVSTQNDNEWYPGFTNNGHYLVALEQADGLWELEQDIDNGDVGDVYPGSLNNVEFNDNSTPSSRDYNDNSTEVSIQNISSSSPIMSADFIINLETRVVSVDYNIMNTSVELNITINLEMLADWRIVVDFTGGDDLNSMEIITQNLGNIGPGTVNEVINFELPNSNPCFSNMKVKLEHDMVLFWWTDDEIDTYFINDCKSNQQVLDDMFGVGALNSQQVLKKYSPFLKTDFTYGLNGLRDYCPKNISQIINSSQLISNSSYFDPIPLSSGSNDLLLDNSNPDSKIDFDDPFTGITPFAEWDSDLMESLSNTLYGRILVDDISINGINYDDLIILQYWMPYYVNHLDLLNFIGNYHEGEVENISIILSFENDILVPLFCAYSKHYSGTLAYWDDVAKIITGNDESITYHPVVYVANGSHASFFSNLSGENSHGSGDQFYHYGKYEWFVEQESSIILSSSPDYSTYELIELENLNNLLVEDEQSWLKFLGYFGGTNGILDSDSLQQDINTDSPFLFPYTSYSNSPNRWVHPGSWIESLENSEEIFSREFNDDNLSIDNYSCMFNTSTGNYEIEVTVANVAELENITNFIWYYKNYDGNKMVASITSPIESYTVYVPSYQVSNEFELGFVTSILFTENLTPYNYFSTYDYFNSFDINICPPVQPEGNVVINPSELTVNLIEEIPIAIQIGNIENLFAFATDVIYSPDILSPISITEGELLNENGTVATTFQYTIDEEIGRIIIGVSRLNNSIPGVNVQTPESAVNIIFESQNFGDSNVNLENVGLIAPDGVTFYTPSIQNGIVHVVGDQQTVQVFTDPAEIIVDLPEEFEIDINVGQVNDLFAFASDVHYDPSIISVTDVIEGDFLNEGGTANTSLMYDIDNQNGTVLIGLSRLENPASGVSSLLSSNSILTLACVSNTIGTATIDLENVGLLAPNGITSYQTNVANGQIQVVVPTDVANLGFFPENTSVYRTEEFDVDVTIDNIANLFAFACDVNYDSDRLEVISLTEGTFMSENGAVSTSFIWMDDGEGTIITGLTRLDNSIPGVSTTGEESLFTISLKAIAEGSASINLDNVGLLAPDGQTQYDYNLNTGTVNVNPTIQLIMQPSPTIGKDTYISSGQSGINFGDDTFLEILKSGETCRGLIQFDVSGISNEAIAAESFLKLYCFDLIADTEIKLGTLQNEWFENNVTWGNCPNNTDIGVSENLSSTGWIEFDISETCQNWINSTEDNNGVLLRLVNEGTNGGGDFYSSDEFENNEFRPLLEINYYIPSASTGLIEGTVTDAISGANIENAQVDLSGILTNQTFTNNQGEYSFNLVPQGVGYNITAIKDGYLQNQQLGIEVLASQTTTVDIELTPENIPLEPPDNLVIQIYGSDVLLSWDEVQGADAYNIYRSTEPYFIPSPTLLIGSSAENSFSDEGVLNNNQVIFYTVTSSN